MLKIAFPSRREAKKRGSSNLQIHQNSMKNQGCVAHAFLEWRLGAKSRHHPLFPGPILRPWGDLGRHLGTQLGAKGALKSNILASRRAKMSKNEVQNEASKKV